MYFVVFCVFVISCGSLAPNKGIVRFTCRGGKSYTLFAYIFMKIVQCLYGFLGFKDFCAFFIDFLSLFVLLLVCI